MAEKIKEFLTNKDSKSACGFADKIIKESEETNAWYLYFDNFASLLNHKNSLVRNRAINILSAILKWDTENKFDLIINDFFTPITDEKPITSRQCIQSLSKIGISKPIYIPLILSKLKNADLSKYKDSMRPLIEKDIKETEKILLNYKIYK